VADFSYKIREIKKKFYFLLKENGLELFGILHLLNQISHISFAKIGKTAEQFLSLLKTHLAAI
jgi:hypothetical protein